MSDMEVRNATEDDIKNLVIVDREAFPPGWPEHLFLNEKYFRAWLEVFPEGFFVAVIGGRVVGYAAVEIIDHDVNNPILNWYQATDNGFIRKTHNPSGNTIYGVSFCASRHANGQRVGGKLMKAVIDQLESIKTVQFGVIGSRLPGFHKSSSHMTVEEYASAERKNGQAIDPLVAFYQRCGFRKVRVLHNYIEDPASHNCGMLMVFLNPNYQGQKDAVST